MNGVSGFLHRRILGEVFHIPRHGAFDFEIREIGQSRWLIREFASFEHEQGKIRQMSYNATGVKVEVDDAHAIGEAIRDKILPKLPEKGRMFADLRITDEPDDMTLFRDDDEQWKNYSVTRDWLKEFSEFCLQSKGFQIF